MKKTFRIECIENQGLIEFNPITYHRLNVVIYCLSNPDFLISAL